MKKNRTSTSTAAAIPAAQQEQIIPVPLSELALSPLNPRRRINPAELAELAASVRQSGITAPLIAWPAPENNGHSYDVLGGGRRLRVAQELKLDQVPVIVRNYTPQQAREFAQIDNIQRADAHPMEEALAYKAMLESGDYDGIPAIAARLGKTEEYIYKRSVLWALTPPAQDRFLDGIIGVHGAYRIATLQPADQERCLDRFYAAHAEKDWKGPVLSELIYWIRHNVLTILKSAPFDIKDAKLVPAAGACTKCPKRTEANKRLWEEDLPGSDRCTDRDCYRSKIEAVLRVQRERLAKSKRGFIEVSDIYGAAPEGALGISEYARVLKGEECSSTKVGLIVQSHTAFGKTMLVCADQDCETHLKVKAAAQPTGNIERDQQLAAMLDTEIRRRTLKGIIARLKAPLNRADLDLIAKATTRRLTADDQKQLWKVMGWAIPKGTFGRPPETPFLNALKQWTDGEVLTYLVAVALASEVRLASYTNKAGTYNGPLFDTANRMKVPVDAIKKYCKDGAKIRSKKRGKEREEALTALKAPDKLVAENDAAVNAEPKPAHTGRSSKAKPSKR